MVININKYKVSLFIYYHFIRASCIRILDPTELKTEHIVELDQNEHPLSMVL